MHRVRLERTTRLISWIVAIGWLFWSGGGALAQTPGMMMEDAGIHFLTPFGFELSRVEVESELGPARMILLEPQDGSYQGEMNSGFLSLTVYSSEVPPASAVQHLLDQLERTFPDLPGPSVTPQPLDLAGSPRDGYRLDFTLADVPLVGYLAAFSQDGSTVLAYYQGRPQEIEALSEVIGSVLGGMGVGPLPEAPAQGPEGTGAGIRMP